MWSPIKSCHSSPLPFFLLSVQRGPNNGGNGMFAPAQKWWFLGSSLRAFSIKKRFPSLSSLIIWSRHESAYVLALLIARNYPNQLRWENGPSSGVLITSRCAGLDGPQLFDGPQTCYSINKARPCSALLDIN